MGRLTNTEFLTQVNTVLSANEGKSSVYLTQKRLSPSLETPPTESLSDLSSNVVELPQKYTVNTQTYPILVRFTTGDSKSKVSTVVEAENLDRFWTEYTKVLKNGFVGLKRKEKKKQKKSKVSKP